MAEPRPISLAPISLAALTVLEVSPLEAARIAARCGYSHIGLRPVAATPTEPHFPILDDRRLSAELARVLAGEGIGVLDVEIVRLVPADGLGGAGARAGIRRPVWRPSPAGGANNDPDPGAQPRQSGASGRKWRRLMLSFRISNSCRGTCSPKPCRSN